MTGRKTTLWFNEIGKEDISLAGGKGANLGELTRAGIPVPWGFVVTSDSYFQFLQESGLRHLIGEALSHLDPNDSAQLHRASDQIKRAITSFPMPAEIAEAIRSAYRELGGGAVAVRSSATAEDLPEHSFAGQQSTFLNVVGEEEVVQAVRACWASLFEARALFYRTEAGFDHLTVGIAVPVQRMVPSRRSGVMFTAEPVSGNRARIVIEAIYGLGEGIVSGQLTPDLYIVERDGLRIVEKVVALQEVQLVARDGPGAFEEATTWVGVPPRQRNEPKLTDAEVRRLAAIGLRVDEYYGQPQDIEWAAEDGDFQVVQARPVTALHEAREDHPLEEESARVLLVGSAASPGVVAGPVRIVLDPLHIDQVRRGEVLVAEMTTPDYVPAMKRAVAIVTDRGGRTCHAAIVSRELGVPCVVGTGRASTTLRPEQTVTVDGSVGKVYEGLAERRLAWYRREVEERRTRVAHLQTRTRIYVNLAEPELAEAVAQRDVDGVGLLRAEFIVAQVGEHPRLALEEGRGEEYTRKLVQGLRTFARAFHPRPVVYRTTDFKTNEYRNLAGGEKYEGIEENPTLGYRGASRYIKDVEVFRLELEAIKRVRREYPNLWVMIPFVRTPEELAATKDIMEAEGLRRSEDFKLWMMVEVPSNVFLLDQFIDVGIDGLSIGSNDLTQLILGIDRDNERLAESFDERNEAVMAAIEQVIATARRRGVTSSICGQAPSVYPEVTQKLVEWGITSISVSPDMIDVTREAVAAAEKLVARAKREKIRAAAPRS